MSLNFTPITTRPQDLSAEARQAIVAIQKSYQQPKASDVDEAVRDEITAAGLAVFAISDYQDQIFLRKIANAYSQETGRYGLDVAIFANPKGYNPFHTQNMVQMALWFAADISLASEHGKPSLIKVHHPTARDFEHDPSHLGHSQFVDLTLADIHWDGTTTLTGYMTEHSYYRFGEDPLAPVEEDSDYRVGECDGVHCGDGPHSYGRYLPIHKDETLRRVVVQYRKTTVPQREES